MKKSIKAEKRVVENLKRKGAKVLQSPGSFGSADVIAKWNSGKKWFVQVKSCQNDKKYIYLVEKKEI